jgi:hypothetical protein
MQQGIKHACGHWEVTGVGSTCHVSAARSIDRDANPEVKPRAAQVGGVDQDGIDDQWSTAIVGGYLEANLIPSREDKPAVDRMPIARQRRTGCRLIHHRLAEAEFVASKGQDKIARPFINPNFPSALEAQSDGMRVSAGRDDKVIFQLPPLGAVINQIHAGIDVLVSHLGIIWYVGTPLIGIVADKIIALARQFLHARHCGAGVCTDEFHAKNAVRGPWSVASCPLPGVPFWLLSSDSGLLPCSD